MMFWNFFKAWARVKWAKIRGYKILAEPETANWRFGLCKICPLFDGVQCEKCGCMAEAKTMILVERCPMGQWCAHWIKKN